MSQKEVIILVGIIISLSLIISIIAFSIFVKFKYINKISKQEQIGIEAEKNINLFLKNWANQNNFFFIESSLYKYGENKLFEVDGILLTNKAIIVVEIKSINGIITGNAEENNWTKTLGKKTFTITNPVYQNDKHIYHITQMLNYKLPILSLIIFSDRAEKLEIENNISHVIITKENNLNQILFDINTSLEEKIDKKTLLEIKRTIEDFRTNDKKDYLTLKSFGNEY
ncbi:nuclease-related domain-containing protein [Mesomycoplasma molare]|uniref:NERD domain-containing protein n=1 Tax=Mesomycoplasma molare TaxID=171288 RepID=A0ABY5TYG2_9BACT|nr:nuclease-related domain-containing protein [Mesomycoplasma molare]UWD34074.1 NERD domain-containing protein [Mesomycoplasma molare]